MTLVPVPEPVVLHPIVVEIIRSLQQEYPRWQHQSGNFFRDDGLSFDTFSQYVWVYDDFRLIHKHGGENCRITIDGKHNSEALKDASRLFKLRANMEKNVPKQAEIYGSIQSKLGL